MKLKNRILHGVASAVGLAAMIGQTQTAQAGWTGYMLGSGSGWAYVSVSPYINGTNPPPKALKTATVMEPGAWMAPITPAEDPSNTNKYTLTTNLPTGASINTIARAKGYAGVKWSSYTSGSNGDKTDAFELQQKVKIKPANCPTLSMNSALIGFNPVTGAGSIEVITAGTPGTALWIRGFEITPGMIVEEDDINTPENETTAFLNEFADLRFENLMMGPFEYGVNGKCELVVHFTLKGGSITNLAFVTDGVALSEPIVVKPPGRQTVACGHTLDYSLLSVSATGGCGKLTYSFSPLVEDLVVGENTVTVTATDLAGDSETATFIVDVTDTELPVLAGNLPDVTGQCSATIGSAPIAQDGCSGPITGQTTNSLSYNTQGTHIVTWTFDDTHGNILTNTQKVIVTDTVAPVAPVLPVVTAACNSPVTGLPIPFAADNCAGSVPVPGTTTTTFPITTVGTHFVIWTFNDGRGNSSTSTQKVVLGGLTLVGFYSPLGAIGGRCDAPVKTINRGSVVPIKFDMKCGSTLITSGPAPSIKVEMWDGCSYVRTLLSVNAQYQNDWHANWDTSGLGKGIYKIIVVLPDGSEPFVFVNLK